MPPRMAFCRLKLDSNGRLTKSRAYLMLLPSWAPCLLVASIVCTVGRLLQAGSILQQELRHETRVGDDGWLFFVGDSEVGRSGSGGGARFVGGVK